MVIRAEKTRNFTVMSNYHLKDETMSLKAVGLLSKMLSLPDDWNFSIEGLARICKDGVDSVRSTLNELIKFGYVEKTERIRDEKGKLRGIDYIIHEQPVSQELEGESEMSDAEQPELENIEEPVLENAVCEEAALKKSVLEDPALNEPVPENPILEKRRLLNTNISNIKELNTNVLNQGAANTNPKKKTDSRAYYPDNEDLNSAFKDFVYMRKRMNRPLIDRAVRLVKDSLTMLAGENGRLNINKAVAILNQSIMNGWSGLYALKTPPDENLVNSAYSAEDMAFFEGNLLAN
ncbi:MAG: helix-turn-helix domain-containing protein [Lachnospiraceae bacterium]